MAHTSNAEPNLNPRRKKIGKAAVRIAELAQEGYEYRENLRVAGAAICLPLLLRRAVSRQQEVVFVPCLDDRKRHPRHFVSAREVHVQNLVDFITGKYPA